MKVEVVSIGTELLLSDVLDTNSAYIARSLQELNAELIYKVTVGDDLARITAAFQIALERADVVLAVGGLGNTPHDYIYRAAATAVNTTFNPNTKTIAGSKPLIAHNPLQNGFVLDKDPGLLICLPSNRREMAFLLETEVYPLLRTRADLQSGWLILRTVGVMESSLRQQLADIELAANQRLTFDSYAGQTNIRLRVMADTPAEIEAQLHHLRRLISDRLGDNIFGEGHDRLEAVIDRMLKRRSYRLALAECHTGQVLTQLLQQQASDCDHIISLPIHDETELAQLLHLTPLQSTDNLLPWCRQAVETMVRHAGVDLGLMVHNATMPGGIQINVFLATAQGVSVTQRSFSGHPQNIDQWACSLGLAHLHRWLLAHA